MTLADIRNEPDDLEQGQAQQDVQPRHLFHAIIRFIESVIHPEVYRTIRHHLSAINNISIILKLSVTKVQSLFQTGIRIFRPISHSRRHHATATSNLNVHTSAGAQHELQCVTRS